MTEQELIENGYRKYSGKEIDVFFNTSLCEHAAVCVRTLPHVFDVKKKPWIQPDNASHEEIAQTIDGCPSGALKYIKK